MALFVSTLEQSSAGLVPAELRAFVLWLLQKMDAPCVALEEDLYRLTLPASQQAAFENRSQVLFTFDAQRYDSAAENDLEFAAPGHRLFAWVIQHALATGAIQQMAPPDQPENVNEITSRLFSAYTIDGGSVHLAGCSLEDRWVVKLITESAQTATPDEILIGPDGNELSDEMRTQLQICGLVPTDAGSDLHPSPRNTLPRQFARRDTSLIARQIQSGLRTYLAACDRISIAETPVACGQSIMQGVAQVVLVRTRWVSGKLRFTLGGETLDATFSGWARSLQPPLVECPRTGKQTRSLTTTDDARLAAQESIVICAISGRRVLEGDLVTCGATGKHVLPEFVGKCCFSGDTVLADSLVRCARCQQLVAPQALSGNRCEGCRKTESVKKSDPRLSLILNEYTNLDGWKRWRLCETHANFITTAWRGLRRMMLVVDKETLQVLYLAKANLRLGWVPIESAEEQAEVLGIWS